MTASKSCQIEVCLLLLTFTGCCHRPVSPSFTSAPGLQPSYLEQGDSLQWVASGQPFQIVFVPDSFNPCKPTDNLINSDGKTNITCHILTNALAGTYEYLYVDPHTAPNDRSNGKVRSGPFVMHVGTCTACSGATVNPGGTLNSEARLANDVDATVLLYCKGTPATSTADSNPTADSVTWKYVGPDPGGPPAFTVNLKGGSCQEYPNDTTIVSQDSPCTVKTNFTYTFTVAGCTANPGQGSITLAK